MKSLGQVIFVFFEDYPEDAEGAPARFDSKLSGHTETLPCLCRKQLSAPDHTADPVRPICTASARLPAHDRGHARKSREHTQSKAKLNAWRRFR
jgi:hypothetical protein